MAGAPGCAHPCPQSGCPPFTESDKLLTSAARIYGDRMEELWGEFLPVPDEMVSVLEDQEIIEVENLRFRALDTPGHATHHMAYLFENICFTGDIGGVRLAGSRYLQLPMPPPEFHLEEWRSSVKRLLAAREKESFQQIAPTHFGIFKDPDWHLAAISKSLDEVEEWMQAIMPTEPEMDDLTRSFMNWTRMNSIHSGISEDQFHAYETANPSWMSSAGIHRYWHKYRANP